MAIEGDLRFLSHHDMMRAMERIVVRAGLPVHYSQGFNPKPKISLACPRPVGVAARQDLLVLSLDEPAQPHELLEKLNACAPRGMRFDRAEQLTGSPTPQPIRSSYEMPVGEDRQSAIRTRLEQLNAQDAWPMDRKVSAGKRRGWRTRSIDLRPLVESIALEGGRLRMTLARQGDRWARPGEVLALLGLDARADLAGMTRNEVEYQI